MTLVGKASGPPAESGNATPENTGAELRKVKMGREQMRRGGFSAFLYLCAWEEIFLGEPEIF
jgi:hypothetical protein